MSISISSQSQRLWSPIFSFTSGTTKSEKLDLASAEPCEMVSDCAPPAKSLPAELDISEDVSDDIDLI